MSPAAVSTQTPSQADESLKTAAGLVASAAVITALVLAAAALGTSILGVPTYFGGGVDSRLGAQVARDFLADQAAESTALSNGDPSALNNHLTGNALVDVSQQISDQSAAGAQPAVTLQPGSLTVLEAQDPVDPSLVLEVEEDGTRSVVTPGGANEAPTEQSISFHGNFWLRKDSSGRYLIADQSIQNQPASFLPALSVIAAAFAAVAIVAVLRRRQRVGRPLTAIALPTTLVAEQAAPVEVPAAESAASVAETAIRTFGALHVQEGGKDWAPALLSRPVTAFVWLRLLVAAIQDPLSRLTRDEIARQASPGVGRDVQLKRLRNFVGRGLKEMPTALSERILVEPDALGFRLDGCAVDALELLRVSRELGNRSRLNGDELAHVASVVRDSRGPFLPEFEAIEDIATDRHPTCTELVRGLRDQLVDKRVDLAFLLADAYLKNGDAVQAIAVLEPAIADRPQRQDLATRLSQAYREAGRDAEAANLEAKKA